MIDEEIYNKLNQIDALEDRVLLKNILNGVFVNLKAETDRKYEQLEKRVFNEVKYSNQRYKIFSTINKRIDIDLTDDFLYAILPCDLNEPVYEVKEILNSLREKKQFELFNIFMECNYLTFKEFINKDINIQGVIKTNKRTYEAKFIVKENKNYFNQIENLYKTFIGNNIPWSTINNPYIHKIAKVVLIGTKSELDPGEKIETIDIDFGEYSKYVKYDMVPMWNVKEIKIKGTSFPMPCVDKITYEHNLSVSKENGYLVKMDVDNINYVMFKKGNIIISSTVDTTSTWEVLEIISPLSKSIKDYKYELMSNEIKENFSNKMLLQNNKNIKTKTDISRLVNSFDVSRYLKFKDVKLIDINNNVKKESYDANDFIADEIRESNIKKSLILLFEPLDKENYLNYDILSFIVSEVQFIYPEYQCEGRII